MHQKSNLIPEQVLYNDRWIDKAHFRAYVYSKDGEKLAENYEEFQALVASGLWFSSKEDINKVLPSKRNAIKAKLNLVPDVKAEEKPASKNTFVSASSTGL